MRIWLTIGCTDCLSPASSLTNRRGDTTPKLAGDGEDFFDPTRRLAFNLVRPVIKVRFCCHTFT